MATPTEIAALIEQAWNLDQEENFFEFLFDLFQTNETLFSMGSTTNDEIKAALEAYIAAGGADGESSGAVAPTDSGDTPGDTTSEA